MWVLSAETVQEVDVVASLVREGTCTRKSGGPDVLATEVPSQPEAAMLESGVIGARTADDFALFFKTHRGCIERFVTRAVSERSEVDDVCADVFLVALRRFEEVATLPEAAARSWLFRVAELRCLKDQRSRCRRDRAYGRAAATCVPNDGPVDDVYLRLADSVGRSDRVHVILASLHPSYREILEMCMEAGGPTGRQLSEALGVTHLAVRVRLTRARHAFRTEYERVFGEYDQVAS